MDSELKPVNEEQFRANRFDLVSRLADDLAHEIKNPLNSIIINLEVLKVRVARSDADGALDRASVIEHEARRLHLMIDRLLQLLRPEREEADSFALDQVFDELMPLIEARARLARNTLSIECDPAVFVPLRRDMFKFAMLNLLTAVHERLGENGGTLRVSCANDGADLKVEIAAVRDPESPRPKPADAEFERSLAVAAALLDSSGAVLEPQADGVSIRLPWVRNG
ncbi:MAG TPA: HAMP domain-containing sensor histidine kinase [Longimicrobiales bacterium]|nr:HAMP domain-containing sensor histidine kinase [Longimicrobiales bacterium]